MSGEPFSPVSPARGSCCSDSRAVKNRATGVPTAARARPMPSTPWRTETVQHAQMATKAIAPRTIPAPAAPMTPRSPPPISAPVKPPAPPRILAVAEAAG